MKKLLHILTVAVLLLTSVWTVAVASGENEGYTFAAGQLYRLEKAPDKTPYTFEAEIYFPQTMPSSQRGGVILGNFGGETRCISFEIYSGGNPRLYWTNENGAVKDLVFRNVNVYNGKWTSVAITMDVDEGKVHCYIDGELKQSLSCTGHPKPPPPKPIAWAATSERAMRNILRVG